MPLDLTFRAAALVAAGAVVGALGRWAASLWLSTDSFPWGTVAVNVVGSFLVGVAMFGGLARGWLSPELRLVFVVGFLGAFTTMSAFAYETVAQADRGFAQAALVVALNPALSVAAAWLGRVVGEA